MASPIQGHFAPLACIHGIPGYRRKIKSTRALCAGDWRNGSGVSGRRSRTRAREHATRTDDGDDYRGGRSVGDLENVYAVVVCSHSEAVRAGCAAEAVASVAAEVVVSASVVRVVAGARGPGASR